MSKRTKTKKQAATVTGLQKLHIIPAHFPISIRCVIWPTDKKQRRAMVFHEKHYDRFYSADTPEEICYACLEVLNNRWGAADNYGGVQRVLNELKDELASLKPPDTPKAELDRLAPDVLNIVAGLWESYDKEIAIRKCELARYEVIAQALNLQCPVRATIVVFQSVNHEYESFDFVLLKDATK